MRLQAIAILLLLPAVLFAQSQRILVGTYTENTSAEGVYLYSFDTGSSGAELLSMAPCGNPSFVIQSPDGRYLLCACRDDNRIEIYRIKPATGALKPTGKCISVGAPVCIQFLK